MFSYLVICFSISFNRNTNSAASVATSISVSHNVGNNDDELNAFLGKYKTASKNGKFGFTFRPQALFGNTFFSCHLHLYLVDRRKLEILYKRQSNAINYSIKQRIEVREGNCECTILAQFLKVKGVGCILYC